MAILRWAAVTLVLVGCSRNKHVEITTFDVEQITAAAMQQFDKDTDAKLTRQELAACPGLLKSIREIDLDKDRALSRDELQARFQNYVDQQIAILPYPIDVTFGGKPLVGATVELIPEEFLAGVIQPAIDQTDEFGTARPSIELEASIKERGTYGFRSGVYQVKISKKDAAGNELLRAKFNEETTLGIELLMNEHMTSLRFDL